MRLVSRHGGVGDGLPGAARSHGEGHNSSPRAVGFPPVPPPPAKAPEKDCPEALGTAGPAVTCWCCLRPGTRQGPGEATAELGNALTVTGHACQTPPPPRKLTRPRVPPAGDAQCGTWGSGMGTSGGLPGEGVLRARVETGLLMSECVMPGRIPARLTGDLKLTLEQGCGGRERPGSAVRQTDL